MNDKPTNLAERISLRPIFLPDDESFLIEVYRSTRDDLKMLPIDEQQKNAILLMQYQAQKQQYDFQYPNADRDIVSFDKKPIGRFIVSRENPAFCVVDISLLPEYRNLGIGTVLLQSVLNEAQRKKRVVVLHVLKTNSAVRLYARLGFVITSETEMHYEMEWRPPQRNNDAEEK